MPFFARNRLSGARPNWHLANSLTRVDLFGRTMPSFSLRGEDTIKTSAGGFMTLILFSIIIIFSYDKSLKVLQRTNPVVNKITQADAID